MPIDGKIADATAQGSDASSLRDQRDMWIKDVSERVGVRSVEDPQGRVTLFGAGEGTYTNDIARSYSGKGGVRVTW